MPSEPIKAQVLYHPDPNADAVVIASETNNSAEICWEFKGDDPASGTQWTAAQWANYFTLSGRATDKDKVKSRIYKNNSCEVLEGGPLEFDSPTTLQWSGDVTWTPGIYILTAVFDDRLTSVIPFAPPECKAPDDAPLSVTIKVHLWKVTVVGVAGDTVVTRGENANYTVTTSSMGFDEEPTYLYHWKSNWFDRPPTVSNTWGGEMVAGTTIQCAVSFNLPAVCAFNGGTTQTLYAASKATAIRRRNWFYVPPGSASVDEMADLGPIDDCTRLTGILLDKTTRQGWTFYPNPFVGGGGNWLDGVDISLVGDDGPNHPLNWIEESHFVIDKQARMNQFINPNGPAPASGVPNWAAANNAGPGGMPCFNSPDILWMAAKFHENLGEHPVVGGGYSGHYAMTALGASLPGNDHRKRLEPLTDTSRGAIETAVNAIMKEIHQSVYQIGDPDHVYVRGNMSALGGDVPHYERRWTGTAWSINAASGLPVCSCFYPEDP